MRTDKKFAIIAGDMHELVRIPEKEYWSCYAWRIHEKDNLWWVPVPNENRDGCKFPDPKPKRVILMRP
jgi:hypothetical protein